MLRGCCHTCYVSGDISLDGIMMTDEIVDVLNRRIEAVYGARDSANTKWAQEYWDTVLAYLLRHANRLN